MRTYLVAATALGLLAWAPASAQSSSQSIRRTADGKPDLNGVWQSGGVSLYGEPGIAKPPAPSVNPPPKREALPYQPWAATKSKTFTPIDDPTLRCLLPGVPRITSMPMPFEIVETPTQIVIAYESFHAFRIIPINNKLEHPDDLVPTWMGDSVARWEGDTLVVDVTGFNDKTWLSGTGSFHSDQLHVVERFQLNRDDTITYTATVTDPKVLTKPWVTGAVLRRPPNTRVEEYECIENNQDLLHMEKAESKGK
ncbi:MAG TPA: hypothetical protein VMB25_02095 [Bryobacteraceae bacterium]|nr:hypothetical protein [Bryobacteraceae bacterium]